MTLSETSNFSLMRYYIFERLQEISKDKKDKKIKKNFTTNQSI